MIGGAESLRREWDAAEAVFDQVLCAGEIPAGLRADIRPAKHEEVADVVMNPHQSVAPARTPPETTALDELPRFSEQVSDQQISVYVEEHASKILPGAAPPCERVRIERRNPETGGNIPNTPDTPHIPPTGRFAPSPTGDLHLGNLRTALLAWLFARSEGGRFLIRVEDLDGSRVRPGIEAAQLKDLKTLGLDHDGEIIRQSERTEIYEAALAKLLQDGLIYPCYCTRAEVRAESEVVASAPHGLSGSIPYPGTCRHLTKRERSEKEAAGRRAAMRLDAGRATGTELPVVGFEDGLLGRVEGVVDDFIVKRGDGGVAYQLAVVVDDAAQGITQVVRGADLADSTPRQVLLSGLLGLPVPGYVHVPLVLGPDGERLAKRHGSVTLKDRLRSGQTPQDILVWMAESLNLEAEGRLPEGLLPAFDPGNLPKEPTIWHEPDEL